MHVIEKARHLQDKIEQTSWFNLDWFSISVMFQLLSVFFFVTGFALFFYVLLCNISFAYLGLLSNPLFYLINGLDCVAVFLIARYVEVKQLGKEI